MFFWKSRNLWSPVAWQVEPEPLPSVGYVLLCCGYLLLLKVKVPHTRPGSSVIEYYHQTLAVSWCYITIYSSMVLHYYIQCHGVTMYSVMVLHYYIRCHGVTIYSVMVLLYTVSWCSITIYNVMVLHLYIQCNCVILLCTVLCCYISAYSVMVLHYYVHSFMLSH